MFWSYFKPPRRLIAAIAVNLLATAAPQAWAQTPPGQTASLSLHAATLYHPSSVTQAKTDAMLAALSAEAGVPYIHPSAPATVRITLTNQMYASADPALCVRAGVGLSVPMMAGQPMIVEHGLVGCPTNTGGLPVIVTQNPDLPSLPSSRTGDYNLNVTVRYRLLRLRHMQLIASLAEQGVAYSIDSPVSGNNVLVAMSLIF